MFKTSCLPNQKGCEKSLIAMLHKMKGCPLLYARCTWTCVFCGLGKPSSCHWLHPQQSIVSGGVWTKSSDAHP